MAISNIDFLILKYFEPTTDRVSKAYQSTIKELKKERHQPRRGQLTWQNLALHLGFNRHDYREILLPNNPEVIRDPKDIIIQPTNREQLYSKFPALQYFLDDTDNLKKKNWQKPITLEEATGISLHHITPDDVATVANGIKPHISQAVEYGNLNETLRLTNALAKMYFDQNVFIITQDEKVLGMWSREIKLLDYHIQEYFDDSVNTARIVQNRIKALNDLESCCIAKGNIADAKEIIDDIADQYNLANPDIILNTMLDTRLQQIQAEATLGFQEHHDPDQVYKELQEELEQLQGFIPDQSLTDALVHLREDYLETIAQNYINNGESLTFTSQTLAHHGPECENYYKAELARKRLDHIEKRIKERIGEHKYKKKDGVIIDNEFQTITADLEEISDVISGENERIANLYSSNLCGYSALQSLEIRPLTKNSLRARDSAIQKAYNALKFLTRKAEETTSISYILEAEETIKHIEDAVQDYTPTEFDQDSSRVFLDTYRRRLKDLHELKQ